MDQNHLRYLYNISCSGGWTPLRQVRMRLDFENLTYKDGLGSIETHSYRSYRLVEKKIQPIRLDSPGYHGRIYFQWIR